ncbi:MAG: cation transporter [Clostridia bacterium]|nr:cation transporter [Clostridia bacterium]
MTNLLIRLFIKNKDNVHDAKVRTAYGTLSGTVGIIVNLLLSAAKLVIGSITHSITITGDALNNLSDAGSSTISLLGFRIASKPADKEHPYGHGRVEYICGLGVSVIIMFMGFELIKSSINKIIEPQAPEFSYAAVIVLVLSILGKLWLALFNRKIGKAINSDTVDAVVKDSLSDMAATAVSIVSLILSQYFSLPFDGIFGVVVSLFVIWAGIGVFRTTLASLLGQPPEESTVKMFEEKIMSYDGVYGVHDLIVHDYGPGRCFVTAHAEVSSKSDIMESHDLMDVIEQEIQNDTGYIITLHMDPIVMDDEQTNATKAIVIDIINEINNSLSIHDFRMVSGPHHTNLIFDVVLPYSSKIDSADLIAAINNKLTEFDTKYYAVVTIDRSYN